MFVQFNKSVTAVTFNSEHNVKVVIVHTSRK